MVSCHAGDSWSSIPIKLLKKAYSTSLSVAACVSEYQQLPSVSMAASKDSLGVTAQIGAEQVSYLGAHILRMKLVSASQLSSTLMILVPCSSRGSISFAYCYRRTKTRSVFPCFAIWWALR